jgi:uncharacterized protein
MLIREVAEQDFDAILALNEESVHFLSPLTMQRLQHLHQQSAYHRVIEADGDICAFLLAFKQGADYDSVNYLWFAKHYPQFLYIDRVVVSAKQQGGGLGKRLYQDIIGFAREKSLPYLVCEFDIEPMNEGSKHFHQRFGFSEVGVQTYGAKTLKKVSLQALAL